MSMMNGNQVTSYEYICSKCGKSGSSYLAMQDHEKSCDRDIKDALRKTFRGHSQ
jgi:hypothetical protein